MVPVPNYLAKPVNDNLFKKFFWSIYFVPVSVLCPRALGMSKMQGLTFLDRV